MVLTQITGKSKIDCSELRSGLVSLEIKFFYTNINTVNIILLFAFIGVCFFIESRRKDCRREERFYFILYRKAEWTIQRWFGGKECDKDCVCTNIDSFCTFSIDFQSVLIEKDVFDHQNVLVKLPCVYLCLSSGDLHFFGKRFLFVFLFFLCYLFFGTFLSTWVLL